MRREILHIDMDAFFASVEELDDPSLRGRPVLVGGPARRGVVAAASYAARAKGARSAMPMSEALRRCPDAIVVPPRRARYAEVSGQMFEIFGRYTPLIEGLSLDEAFLDVTASRALFGDGATIAAAIRGAIRAELGLTASAGVAECKFVAKIASDLDKPDGLVVAPRGAAVAEFLAPLPVERMWGVGPKSAPRLRALGLRTLGDLARAAPSTLALALGTAPAHAARVSRLARGEDDRAVVPHGEARSVGSESTYDQDLVGRAALSRAILQHAEIVGRRLTATGLSARVVTVKLKLADFTLLTRQRSLPTPVSDTQSLHEVGAALLERFNVDAAHIRLVGLSASHFDDHGGTRPLFPELLEPERARRERIEALVGAVNERHAGAMTRASLLEAPSRGDAAGKGVELVREELARLVATKRRQP
ncbi:MAG TPA: DNA polymerase IV [Polyangiaceae bacterium]|nr:DNA polymerase IV [Polyangiaceae bacterium]